MPTYGLSQVEKISHRRTPNDHLNKQGKAPVNVSVADFHESKVVFADENKKKLDNTPLKTRDENTKFIKVKRKSVSSPLTTTKLPQSKVKSVERLDWTGLGLGLRLDWTRTGLGMEGRQTHG
jgi:hypothetical protein